MKQAFAFLESNYFQYGVLAFGALIASEAIYSYYKKRRKFADNGNTYEVFWTNNLSQSCNCSMKKRAESCQNNYCYVRTLRRIISLIDKAKYSIDIAMYIFTSHELFSSIKKARERGVRVRVIVDKNMVYSTSSKIMMMDANDIPVRYHPTSTYLMHHKFCIFDGPSRVKAVNNANTENLNTYLLTGSTNWTNDGFSTNWENIIVTSNLKLVMEFENEYQRIWEDFEKSL